VWSRWIAIASTVLIATGLFNFMMIDRAAKVPGAEPLASTYHMLFGFKFLLALVVMFIASLLAGKSAGAEKARANMSRWLAIAWTCVIAIAILGAMMRLFHAP
jgi:phosphoglucomutase